MLRQVATRSQFLKRTMVFPPAAAAITDPPRTETAPGSHRNRFVLSQVGG